MFIIRHKQIFFFLTLLLVVFSFFSIFYFGLNFGIDFKGGSILEVSYENRPLIEELRGALDKLNFGAYKLQPLGDKNYTLRARMLETKEKTQVMEALSIGGNSPKEERFNSIGPIVGKELRKKSFVAIAVVIFAIIIFITFAFRKVFEPVASWKYGLVAIITLVHDIVIPTGIFVLFSKFYGGEIDLLFVAAILAIFGYSIHDTIVVFDRTRENLRLNKTYRTKEPFEQTVGKSLNQTIVRSINTSLTTTLVLVALYFLGPASTKSFVFILMAGIVVGTYSSIFLASPLLVVFEKFQRRT